MKRATWMTLAQWACGAIFVLAAGTIALRAWPSRGEPEPPALVANQPVLTVGSSASESGGRAQAVFRVRNASHRAVKIADVSTTCTCLVPAGLAGTSILPGQETTLDVQVSIPDLGTSAQRILVFHDGAGSPLALSVKAQGRRQLPVLDVVENGFPLFDDLRDASATQSIVVNTFEAIGSKPWLGELKAAHPSVKITPGNIEEAIDERAGFTRRRYHFALAWSAIPLEREVRSPIYAQTAIDPNPGVFIGSVAALVKRNRLSPMAVHLVRGEAEEDWVLLSGSEDLAAPWKVSERTPLPPWLTAQWQESDGRLRLRVALTKDVELSQQELVQLLLVNSDDEVESLTVVASPGK